MGLAIVSRLLGHADIKTTSRYSHFDTDPLRRAANVVGGTLATAIGEGDITAPKKLWGAGARLAVQVTFITFQHCLDGNETNSRTGACQRPRNTSSTKIREFTGANARKSGILNCNLRAKLRIR